jgi:hypothetical protein
MTTQMYIHIVIVKNKKVPKIPQGEAVKPLKVERAGSLSMIDKGLTFMIGQ